MNPLRIAQVTLSMGQGGIENLLISLVSKQDKLKYHTYVYCLDYGGELIGRIELLGAVTRVCNRSPGLDFKLIFSLAAKFRKDKIDIVHTHNEAAHFYGCLAARLAGIKSVINTEHSRHYLEGHWRRKFEKRFLSLFTHKIVTVSEELRQASIELDRISPDKLSVVLNGIDIDRFLTIPLADKTNIKKNLGFQVNDKIIIIVARLNPIKNHQLLIQAFAKLSEEHPEVQLVVVGDGELRSELEQQSKHLNVHARVHFMGDRTDVPDLLKISDVLVLCSHREGLPLVLLEGMAAQIPIVVTAGANRSEVINPHVTGYVCEDTVCDLAEKLLTVLYDSDNTKITSDAKTLVCDKYSIVQTIDGYEVLYGQCLKKETNSD